LDAEQLGGGEHFIYKNNQNNLTNTFKKFSWKNEMSTTVMMMVIPLSLLPEITASYGEHDDMQCTEC
jgi:hypothetical protein